VTTPELRQPDADDGLRFFATIRKAGGQTLHRETEDRLVFLAWLATHAAPEDDVTLTMEASGPAVPGMLAALRFGARMLEWKRAE
jgi:hypothetical protein